MNRYSALLIGDDEHDDPNEIVAITELSNGKYVIVRRQDLEL